MIIIGTSLNFTTQKLYSRKEGLIFLKNDLINSKFLIVVFLAFFVTLFEALYLMNSNLLEYKSYIHEEIGQKRIVFDFGNLASRLYILRIFNINMMKINFKSVVRRFLLVSFTLMMLLPLIRSILVFIMPVSLEFSFYNSILNYISAGLYAIILGYNSARILKSVQKAESDILTLASNKWALITTVAELLTCLGILIIPQVLELDIHGERSRLIFQTGFCLLSAVYLWFKITDAYLDKDYYTIELITTSNFNQGQEFL